MPAARRLLCVAVTTLAFVAALTTGAGISEFFEPDAQLHSHAIERSAGWG